MIADRTHPFLLKVNRVATGEEAQALEAAGADLVGFHEGDDVLFDIETDPFWTDERYVYSADLAELAAGLTRAEAFVETTSYGLGEALCAKARAAGMQRIQIGDHLALKPSALEACRSHGLSLYYGGRYITAEDVMMAGDLAAAEWPLLEALDLQVFTSTADAWALLSSPPPELTGDIVLMSDLLSLAARLPLFVSLNLTPANCEAVLQALTSTPIRGLSLTLSPESSGAYHTVTVEHAAEILAIAASYLGKT